MKTNRLYAACVLLTMTLLLFIGCAGGGTTGTGGLQFSGTLNKSLAKALTLKASNGEPIVGALVTLAETGESDLTNDEGFFEINSSATGLSSATLIIEGDDLSCECCADIRAQDDANRLVGRHQARGDKADNQHRRHGR